MNNPAVSEPVASEGFDMTPMIDVVFLLIIFFMIVTKINEDKLELLTLPSASQAVPLPGGERLILNVDKDGGVKVNGRAYAFPELESLLDREVVFHDGSVEEARMRRGSRVHILLRADESAQYYHLQEIMRLLADRCITNMDIATADPR